MWLHKSNQKYLFPSSFNSHIDLIPRTQIASTKLLPYKGKVLRLLVANIRFLITAPQWFNCDTWWKAVLQKHRQRLRTRTKKHHSVVDNKLKVVAYDTPGKVKGTPIGVATHRLEITVLNSIS